MLTIVLGGGMRLRCREIIKYLSSTFRQNIARLTPFGNTGNLHALAMQCPMQTTTTYYKCIQRYGVCKKSRYV